MGTVAGRVELASGKLYINNIISIYKFAISQQNSPLTVRSAHASN